MPARMARRVFLADAAAGLTALMLAGPRRKPKPSPSPAVSLAPGSYGYGAYGAGAYGG